MKINWYGQVKPKHRRKLGNCIGCTHSRGTKLTYGHFKGEKLLPAVLDYPLLQHVLLGKNRVLIYYVLAMVPRNLG